MNLEIQQLCDSLDTLATATKNAWGNDTLMIEAIGWQAPALTRHDLAFLASQLAHDIRAVDAEVTTFQRRNTYADRNHRLWKHWRDACAPPH